MHRSLPLLAWVLGVAGLIPFFACGYLALTPDGAPGTMALLAYGAVILAFLGAFIGGSHSQNRPDGASASALAWVSCRR